MVDNPTAVDDEEGDAALIDASSSRVFIEKLSVLKKRCDAVGIQFLELKDGEGDIYGRFSLPAGRGSRQVAVYNEEKADYLLSTEFEKYCFLSGYDAICCYESNYIEVGLQTTHLNSRFLLQQLQERANGPQGGQQSIVISPPDLALGRPQIELGLCSNAFHALFPWRISRISLKLRGIRARQHDQAIAELRSYADSLFFQIDKMIGSTFILARERRLRLSLRGRRRSDIQLNYPSALYNHEAISLYWYAKSARDMPLLRFLAFYQSIEFYFPRYSQTEVRKRVGSIVKHPAFRPHRDDDLDRLIAAVSVGRQGGLGNERTQLRAVLAECISAEEVREYLMSSDERKEHFSGKLPKAKFHKIPLANTNADLRNDIADRIYDIRCKIVHTKSDDAGDDRPIILPFSEDADHLLPDIDLIEFIAECVLVASSGELT